jgi:catechol 2,3-dioxygenase-like lactoylglutathione lyase family enzyme
MRRIHVALAVRDYDAAVRDYTRRLGAEPCGTVQGVYALWRTEEVNLSIRVNPSAAGTLRHLGFEDASASEFTQEEDAEGIVWERFAPAHQDAEIRAHWPEAVFR